MCVYTPWHPLPPLETYTLCENLTRALLFSFIRRCSGPWCRDFHHERSKVRRGQRAPFNICINSAPPRVWCLLLPDMDEWNISLSTRKKKKKKKQQLERRRSWMAKWVLWIKPPKCHHSLDSAQPLSSSSSSSLFPPTFVISDHSACMWALSLTFQHTFAVGYHQPFVEGNTSIAEGEPHLLCFNGLLLEEKAGPAASAGRLWFPGRPIYTSGSWVKLILA